MSEEFLSPAFSKLAANISPVQTSDGVSLQMKPIPTSSAGTVGGLRTPHVECTGWDLLEAENLKVCLLGSYASIDTETTGSG